MIVSFTDVLPCRRARTVPTC